MGTRRLLKLQLVVLVALTVFASWALFRAYDDTHRRPAAVRDGTAPAILEVAAAHSALINAHRAADQHIQSGLTDETSTDETYRTYLAAAVQSLSQIADRQVAGEDGKRTLSTVNALLVVYREAMDLAIRYAEEDGLGEAWFNSADTILNREQTGILSRLGELQDDQLEELSEQTVFSGDLRAVWRQAQAALTVLALALIVCQVQLFRRFPQRLNPALLLVCALVLASWLPVQWAQNTQRQLDIARDELGLVVDQQREQQRRARDDVETGKREPGRAPGPDRGPVVAAGDLDKVRDGMDETVEWESRGVWIWLGGFTAAGLSTAGLWRHLGQYYGVRP